MVSRLCFSLFLAVSVFAAKRPLGPGDYDAWRHIQNQQLSASGRFLAYAVFPRGPGQAAPGPGPEPAGRARRPVSGELTIRNLKNTSARKIEGVTEYLLKNDGARAVYAVDAKNGDESGVYWVDTAGTSQP